jgi:hypothetical protein
LVSIWSRFLKSSIWAKNYNYTVFQCLTCRRIQLFTFYQLTLPFGSHENRGKEDMGDIASKASYETSEWRFTLGSYFLLRNPPPSRNRIISIQKRV